MSRPAKTFKIGEENLKAAEIFLSDAELKEVERAVR
jgi:hypothetical protein